MFCTQEIESCDCCQASLDGDEEDDESKDPTDNKVVLATAAQQAELVHLRAEQKVQPHPRMLFSLVFYFNFDH